MPSASTARLEDRRAPDIVPAFFIAGAESEFWPAEHAAASAALNPAATSTGLIERVGHAANIEQPQRFNEAPCSGYSVADETAGFGSRAATSRLGQSVRASSVLPGAHPLARASRCKRCTASPTHSELSNIADRADAPRAGPPAAS